MKYRAYLKQVDEGCDYTIGCTQIVVEIQANNIDEAKQKLSKLIIEEYSYDEGKLESCELYEINEIFVIDVGEIYSNKTEIKLHKNEIEYLKDAVSSSVGFGDNPKLGGRLLNKLNFIDNDTKRKSN